MRQGCERSLVGLGWHKAGASPDGLDVWTIEFGEDCAAPPPQSERLPILPIQ